MIDSQVRLLVESQDEAIHRFTNAFRETRPQSTGWRIDSDFTGVLYNVRGSHPDPKIPGYPNWKDLLVREGGLEVAI